MRFLVIARLILTLYLAQLSPSKSKSAIPSPSRAFPLPRSKVMDGVAAVIAGVPSPFSLTSILLDPLPMSVRKLKPWMW
jgi:hypothetical protein